MVKNLLIIMLFAFISIIGCKTQKLIKSSYQYETECIGSGLDGTVTVIGYGTGMNGKEAISQSIKNGLYDLLFKGTRSNKAEYTLKPIVPEVNARYKYENYFNEFFKKNGAYLNFISTESNPKKLTTEKSNNGSPRILYETTFQVKRSELIRKMIDDQILIQP